MSNKTLNEIFIIIKNPKKIFETFVLLTTIGSGWAAFPFIVVNLIYKKFTGVNSEICKVGFEIALWPLINIWLPLFEFVFKLLFSIIGINIE